MSSRAILITGANGGLGQAIARAFLHDPSNSVWLGVHSRREQADRIAAEFPRRCHCLNLDVTRPDSWSTAVTTVMASGIPFEVLVNNAGTHQDGLLATMPPAAWDEVIAASLTGAFHGCQAVLPEMISRRRGRIINVASLSALLAPPGQTNYAAAKAGLIALTQSLAKEVARLNITVNAVCPGFIDTTGLGQMNDDERKAALGKIPMRRFGRPEEVAAAVQFLACPDASYITGSVLKIDGGIL